MLFVEHALAELKFGTKGILILGHPKITPSAEFSLEIEQLSIKGLEAESRSFANSATPGHASPRRIGVGVVCCPGRDFGATA